MSELSVKVAREHWFTMNNGWHCVGCGYSDYAEANDHGYTLAERRHLAEVTEAAVRETIAADMTAETRTTTTCAGPNAEGEGCPDWWRYRSCAHTITQTRNVTPWKDADA